MPARKEAREIAARAVSEANSQKASLLTTTQIYEAKCAEQLEQKEVVVKLALDETAKGKELTRHLEEQLAISLQARNTLQEELKDKHKELCDEGSHSSDGRARAA